MTGYRKALIEAGIPVDKSLIFEGNYRIDSGEIGAENLIQKNVTSIFCQNDMMAYGTLNALYQMGLSVPEDISIVGFDDSIYSRIMRPPLTTIRQPYKEMGEMAAGMLLRAIQGEKIKENIIFKPMLVERESVKNIKL